MLLEDVPELQARIAGSDLLVNATSVGMDGQSSPVPESIILSETILGSRYHLPTL